MSITKEPFGTVDGQAVDLYTLTNASGAALRVTTYGGIITSLQVPDRDGHLADVVLGFDSLDGYLGEHPYFGAAIGRFGNRIGDAKFTLDGVEYQLAKNDGDNHLHGGIKGFDKVVWTATKSDEKERSVLVLRYVSPDGEENYPGTLTVTIFYTWTHDNVLWVSYQAETDKATPVNLTNHSYFNLAGNGTGDILGHELTVFADAYTPVDDSLIPTGEIATVEGTPLDFRTPTAIGDRIEQAGGYDHNFVLRDQDGSPAFAARVLEPSTGRVLECLTTEPGVQLYTGNFLDGSLTGKDGTVYHQHAGFCLETQHYPDSPNQPTFPSCILRPGEEYRTTTVYRFSAE